MSKNTPRPKIKSESIPCIELQIDPQDEDGVLAVLAGSKRPVMIVLAERSEPNDEPRRIYTLLRPNVVTRLLSIEDDPPCLRVC